MELAKVTAKGQITIPISIRKKLGVKEGDKVLFFEDNGKIILTHASLSALLRAQSAMEGVADELGINDEDDVAAMVKEIRAERAQVKP